MAKQKFQDIAMGYYDYQKAIQNSQAQMDQTLRSKSQNFKVKYDEKGQLKVLDQFLQKIPNLSDQQRKLLKSTISNDFGIQNSKDKSATSPQKQQVKVIYQTIPIRSAVYNKNNLFTVDMVQHKEYQLNKQNKIIHSNYPMTKSNDYYLQSQYTFQVTCQNLINEMKSIYVSKATMISPYQLFFNGNITKCERIISVSPSATTLKPYTSPFYTKKIRAYQNYLFGQIQQACTNNWDWSMNSQNDDFAMNRPNYIQKGSVLMITVTLNVSGFLKTGHHSLNVRQIIAPQVLKVEENVGSFLNISGDKTISEAWISGCRLISNKPINKETFMDKNGIINKKNDDNQIRWHPKKKNNQAIKFYVYVDIKNTFNNIYKCTFLQGKKYLSLINKIIIILITSITQKILSRHILNKEKLYMTYAVHLFAMMLQIVKKRVIKIQKIAKLKNRLKIQKRKHKILSRLLLYKDQLIKILFILLIYLLKKKYFLLIFLKRG